MPQSFGPIYLHLVFSTKHREHLLSSDLHSEFTRYITPILTRFHVQFIAEGGMQDHVHLLIDLGREVSVAVLLREIKANSSKWMKKKTGKDFRWQIGYGVFSVSPRLLPTVIRYIQNQEAHHARVHSRER